MTSFYTEHCRVSADRFFAAHALLAFESIRAPFSAAANLCYNRSPPKDNRAVGGSPATLDVSAETEELTMSRIIEYQVRPITRFIVTRFHAYNENSSGAAGSECMGEFYTEDQAMRIAEALSVSDKEGTATVVPAKGASQVMASGALGMANSTVRVPPREIIPGADRFPLPRGY